VAGKHQVQDDQIGPFFARRAQRVGARAGGRDAVTLFSKVVGDERRDVGLVVDDENAVWFRGLRRYS